MARPQIMRINPFDANKDYEITLSWMGNRAHANRIVKIGRASCRERV